METFEEDRSPVQPFSPGFHAVTEFLIRYVIRPVVSFIQSFAKNENDGDDRVTPALTRRVGGSTLNSFYCKSEPQEPRHLRDGVATDAADNILLTRKY